MCKNVALEAGPLAGLQKLVNLITAAFTNDGQWAGKTNTTIQAPFNHCDIFVATWGYVTPLTFAASCGAAADELFISIFFFYTVYTVSIGQP